MVLVLLGGTTWANDGVWAPDGAYSRVIWPILALVWIAIVSGFLYVQSASTESGPAAGFGLVGVAGDDLGLAHPHLFYTRHKESLAMTTHLQRRPRFTPWAAMTS